MSAFRRLGLLLVALAAPASAQVASPRAVAAAVLARLEADTVFELRLALAAPEHARVVALDVFGGRPGAPGRYVARAEVTVAEGAPPLRLGASAAPGRLAVRVAGQTVMDVDDRDARQVAFLDYDGPRFERSAALEVGPGTHAVEVRFTPSDAGAPGGGRLALGVLDAATGLSARSARWSAPAEVSGLPESARFVTVGPLSGEPPPLGPGWGLPAAPLARVHAGPLDLADWRYFTGTFLDALARADATFPGLGAQGYVERHIRFGLETAPGVLAEAEAAGLPEPLAFGHLARFRLLDDVGMQAVPLLGRPDPAARALVERAVAAVLAAPRVAGGPADGTFARINPDSLTVWADDLFMGSVLLARAAGVLDRPALFDEAARQSAGVDAALRDPATGLYHHGFFARTGERSSSRWARANGWVMLARAEILAALPARHPARAATLAQFRAHAEALRRVQGPDGRWHQVLDRPETYLETSATAMFTAAFAEGLARGWLGAEFRESAERGWAAVARQVRPDGHVEGIVRGTPIFYSDAAYDAHAPRRSDPRGLGAVLYAASAMQRLHAAEARTARAVRLAVSNPLDAPQADAAVVVPRAELTGLPATPLRATHAGRDLPGQRDDLDGDGRWDVFSFVLPLGPRETAEVRIEATAEEPAHAARTQASLRVREGGRWAGRVYEGGTWGRVSALDVPAEQAQDSRWADLEGPTWESDRAGFRLYLDRRHRTDAFGKRLPAPALHDVAGDYHAGLPWGADVLKVGQSLGLATPAALTDAGFVTLGTAARHRVEVVASGPVRSILRITAGGWAVGADTVDAVSEVEIWAGRRLYEQRIALSGPAAGRVRLVTGLVRHPSAPLDVREAAGHTVAVTWGPQADRGEGLGLGLVLPRATPPLSGAPADTHTFALAGPTASYRAGIAWAFEPDAPASADAFAAALAAEAAAAAAPVSVRRIR